MTINDMRDLVDIKLSRLNAQLYDAVKLEFDKDSINLNRPCQFALHGCDVLVNIYFNCEKYFLLNYELEIYLSREHTHYHILKMS